ncbi:MAG: hypothetical protein HYZ11_00145 [Candidatus Tectomicrobia bacterium]|uniref:Uncharacterized protein n=1 Tax=Tectimicrobiota bacterium TaxID=2528274 RepID=A0A932MLY7_UNCTE|nr:hypothetical protein [Candidatus Tectomicrobia bacterium]
MPIMQVRTPGASPFPRAEIIAAVIVGLVALLFRISWGGIYSLHDHYSQWAYFNSVLDPVLSAADPLIQTATFNAPPLTLRAQAFIYSLGMYPAFAFFLIHACIAVSYGTSYLLFREGGAWRPLAAAGVIALPFTMETPLGLAGGLKFYSGPIFLVFATGALLSISRRGYLFGGLLLVVSFLSHPMNSSPFILAVIAFTVLRARSDGCSWSGSLKAGALCAAPFMLYALWFFFGKLAGAGHAAGIQAAGQPLGILEWRNLCWLEDPDDCTVLFWLFHGYPTWRAWIWLPAVGASVIALAVHRWSPAKGRIPEALLLTICGFMALGAIMELTLYRIFPGQLLTLALPVQFRRLFSWVSYAAIFVLAVAASRVLEDAEKRQRIGLIEMLIALFTTMLLLAPRVRYFVPTVLLFVLWPVSSRLPFVRGWYWQISARAFAWTVLILIVSLWSIQNAAAVRQALLITFPQTIRMVKNLPKGDLFTQIASSGESPFYIGLAEGLRIREWLEKSTLPDEILIVQDEISTPRMIFRRPVLSNINDAGLANVNYDAGKVWWNQVRVLYPIPDATVSALHENLSPLDFMTRACSPGKKDPRCIPRIKEMDQRMIPAERLKKAKEIFGARFFISRERSEPFLVPVFQAGPWVIYRIS